MVFKENFLRFLFSSYTTNYITYYHNFAYILIKKNTNY